MPEDCVILSFRYGFRDRLREVECLFDIVGTIAGWKTSGVDHGYGNGYPLKVLNRWTETL